MNKKIEFLRKYRKNAQLILCNEINTFDYSQLPDFWYDLFQEKSLNKRVERILYIWNKYVGIELRNTISYLSRHLKEIDLIMENNKYSILYTIETDNGEIQYYEGRNPKEAFNNIELGENWDKFPLSLRSFYQNIHNGFYLYASKSLGLVPLENVTFFDEDEWGIIEELEEPLQIDLKTTFGFFKSGMGGYVAIDFNNCDNENAVLWWTDEEPRYNINFWDIVDEWIVIGFES
ncbi:SMI1/KNR4 family protein [Lysinibacillus mangiferihumi]|uniref:SMI1/KNR4 family protein n=1 Tax=Lysinibacillus mangiferihumi TaxID=1130819 RepID=A0A4U2Y0Q9_9BACI|nr:SMI1/KNR4 family protein [Lysinibacillus mangiferihumi]TKI53425.1 SMI1/KNR4 family protein [Lysinibacillus mangiferihumi]